MRHAFTTLTTNLLYIFKIFLSMWELLCTSSIPSNSLRGSNLERMRDSSIMHETHLLSQTNNPTKCCQNISNGIGIMEPTRMCLWTYWQMPGFYLVSKLGRLFLSRLMKIITTADTSEAFSFLLSILPIYLEWISNNPLAKFLLHLRDWANSHQVKGSKRTPLFPLHPIWRKANKK